MIQRRLLRCLVPVGGLWLGERLEWTVVVLAVYRDLEAVGQCQYEACVKLEALTRTTRVSCVGLLGT